VLGSQSPSLHHSSSSLLSAQFLAFRFIPRLDQQNTRMARKASSKPESSNSSATIGFESDSSSFGIRHLDFVISSAHYLADMNLILAA